MTYLPDYAGEIDSDVGEVRSRKPNTLLDQEAMKSELTHENDLSSVHLNKVYRGIESSMQSHNLDEVIEKNKPLNKAYDKCLQSQKEENLNISSTIKILFMGKMNLFVVFLTVSYSIF